MLDTNSIYSNFVMLAIAHNRFYRPVEDIKVRIVNPCLWLNTFYNSALQLLYILIVVTFLPNA